MAGTKREIVKNESKYSNGGEPYILVEGEKYILQKDTGRVYPWHEQLLRRADVVEFIHRKAGDEFIKRDPKPKYPVSFGRDAQDLVQISSAGL